MAVTSADGSATRTYTLSLHRKLEWADFELGWTHGCGLRSDGRIICSGERDGVEVMHSNSAYVPSAPGHYVYRDVHRQDWSIRRFVPEWGGVNHLASFSVGGTCWVSPDSAADCWGIPLPSPLSDEVHQMVAVAYNLSCVLDSEDAIRATPGTAVIEHISLGYNPSSPRRCGLTSEGRIQCWTRMPYEPLLNPDWMED